MKIGILSDTHKKVGRSQQAIDLLRKKGAEQLFHAGDIVKVDVLQQLESSKLPYIAVLGNNDGKLYQYADDYNLVEEPYHFEIDEPIQVIDDYEDFKYYLQNFEIRKKEDKKLVSKYINFYYYKTDKKSYKRFWNNLKRIYSDK